MEDVLDLSPSPEPACRQLLLTYQSLAQQQLAERPAATEETATRVETWIPRVYSLPDLPDDDLCALHGTAIAQGWLVFQLEDGQRGLSYRVSPEGRQALKCRAPDEGLETRV